ncbi:MAG: hypothetical protein QNJ54_14715 [Prochloraceae cyanobacterium]|nr:hypothetical protein [Prochloraceae cyanobacterium]
MVDGGDGVVWEDGGTWRLGDKWRITNSQQPTANSQQHSYLTIILGFKPRRSTTALKYLC